MAVTTQEPLHRSPSYGPDTSVSYALSVIAIWHVYLHVKSDGQKRPVYIYRFLTTNAIDEKIYQRQITKTGLSDQMMDQTRSEKQTSKDCM